MVNGNEPLCQQPFIMALDGLVALASALLELLHVEETDVASAVLNPAVC